MCVGNKLGQKEFRRKGGIEILKKNLVYQNVIDQIGNQKIFIMVVLDCLWNSIIGNKRNEEQFIDMDGIFTIFELLEQSDNIHIKLILSCLASLVDNKRSYSYFLQWKSNNNSNIDAYKLLINIYRSEDAKYLVSYDKGILQETERPINPNTSYLLRKKMYEDELNSNKLKSKMQAEQNYLAKTQLNNSFDKLTKTENMTGTEYITKSLMNTNKSNDGNNFFSTASVIDAQDELKFEEQNIHRSENFVETYLNQKIIDITKEFDLRGTIFSIFYRIGFNNISLSSSEDKQTFIMIKNYPVFKNLENWQDVIEELKDNKIDPISDDWNYIMTQLEESKEKLKFAVRQQETIFDLIKKEQQDDLKDYFKKIEDFSKLQMENKKLKDKEQS